MNNNNSIDKILNIPKDKSAGSNILINVNESFLIENHDVK